MLDGSTFSGKKSRRNLHSFSLQDAIDARATGFTALRRRLNEAAALGAALDHLDASLQVFTENRSADEMQAVITAARHLSDVLSGSAVPQ